MAELDMKTVRVGQALEIQYTQNEDVIQVHTIRGIGPFDSFVSALLGSSVISDDKEQVAQPRVTPEQLDRLPNGPQSGPDLGATPHVSNTASLPQPPPSSAGHTDDNPLAGIEVEDSADEDSSGVSEEQLDLPLDNTPSQIRPETLGGTAAPVRQASDPGERYAAPAAEQQAPQGTPAPAGFNGQPPLPQQIPPASASHGLPSPPGMQGEFSSGPVTSGSAPNIMAGPVAATTPNNPTPVQPGDIPVQPDHIRSGTVTPDTPGLTQDQQSMVSQYDVQTTAPPQTTQPPQTTPPPDVGGTFQPLVPGLGRPPAGFETLPPARQEHVRQIGLKLANDKNQLVAGLKRMGYSDQQIQSYPDASLLQTALTGAVKAELRKMQEAAN